MASNAHLINIKKSGRINTFSLALLQKLDIDPFTYGMNFIDVYNSGSLFGAYVLATAGSVQAEKFIPVLDTISKLLLALYLSTKASVMRSMTNTCKVCLAVTVKLKR